MLLAKDFLDRSLTASDAPLELQYLLAKKRRETQWAALPRGWTNASASNGCSRAPFLFSVNIRTREPGLDAEHGVRRCRRHSVKSFRQHDETGSKITSSFGFALEEASYYAI
ncbi:hypothetical protein PSPO01_15359 [Paraphaeosphaeria sporulosa]